MPVYLGYEEEECVPVLRVQTSLGAVEKAKSVRKQGLWRFVQHFHTRWMHVGTCKKYSTAIVKSLMSIRSAATAPAVARAYLSEPFQQIIISKF
jgi:hypothetical protein